MTLQTAADWQNPCWPRLWLYNLHYFDDLASDAAAAHRDWHRALVARWIGENPPMQGPGWEPYPLSLRIANWIKSALGPASGGPAWTSDRIASLALQVRCLLQLEYHLLGNHLWANAEGADLRRLLLRRPGGPRLARAGRGDPLP